MNIPVERIRETIEVEGNLCFYDMHNKVWEVLPSFILEDYYQNCLDVDAKYVNIVPIGTEQMDEHEAFVMSAMHETWLNAMCSFLFSDGYRNLIKQLLSENNRKRLYPVYTRIFNAYLKPLDEVKGVIINVSPINNESATGLAFATHSGKYNPEINLFMETYKKATGRGSLYQMKPDLQALQDEGVLLINCALTSTAENRVGHINTWSPFIQEVIKALNSRTQLCFLLLGQDAQNLSAVIDKRHNVFLAQLLNYYMVKGLPVPIGVYTQFFNQLKEL